MDVYGDAKVFDMFMLLRISPFWSKCVSFPTYFVCELFSDYYCFCLSVFFIFIGVNVNCQILDHLVQMRF